MVRAQDVSRRSGGSASSGIWILRQCSLEIPRGGLTAIVGPSGAGKTSLLYCLSGLDRPESGQVAIDGTDIYALSRERRARFLRTRVGFVFQQYNLIPYLTVVENVLLPESLAGRRVPHDAVAGMLARFGLADKRSTPASALSGGEQQRVALCRAMLLGPAVVFADEPTGALDTANSHVVLRVLRDLADSGTSVVMVTHDVDAAALADGVVFMRDGAITGVSGRMDGQAILAGMRPTGTSTRPSPEGGAMPGGGSNERGGVSW
jgi:putative ABC transport system ATP-binding protein